MKTENFDFIEYCKSRGLIKKSNGNMLRKVADDFLFEVRFLNGRYIIPVTPDFYFSKEIPKSKEVADHQFEVVQKITGIELPILNE
ncbi:hypothetical protein [Chryseobacterium sp.]|uniref:hypothetical protein n=1 Tax=Chryseobacterium sp. TaxID=1871047 RepID=UPI0012A900AD|nr:hypothetical protein [Chryseobacterium sp.]QFG54492.1 hypothetical protein F7R58_12820 [Chryseobacterium sp.]